MSPPLYRLSYPDINLKNSILCHFFNDYLQKIGFYYKLYEHSGVEKKYLARLITSRPRRTSGPRNNLSASPLQGEDLR